MPSTRAGQTGSDSNDNGRYEQYDLTDGTSHAAGAPITATGATDFADVTYLKKVALNVVNGVTNTVIFTPEGSLDGVNWFPLTFKVAGTTAIATGARTTPAATAEALFLSDIDYIRFLRVNVGTANANGTTFKALGLG